MTNFNELGLSNEILRAVSEMGFEMQPTYRHRQSHISYKGEMC